MIGTDLTMVTNTSLGFIKVKTGPKAGAIAKTIMVILLFMECRIGKQEGENDVINMLENSF